MEAGAGDLGHAGEKDTPEIEHGRKASQGVHRDIQGTTEEQMGQWAALRKTPGAQVEGAHVEPPISSDRSSFSDELQSLGGPQKWSCRLSEPR
jgi:hypothetical protein